MSLIVVDSLSLSFSGKTLFDRIGFQINRQDRIGLVGANGTGKTSFLRLLVGEVSPDHGEVSKAHGVRIGYLPQDISKISQGTLLASVLNAIPGKMERDRQLKRLETNLEQEKDPERQTALSHEIAELYSEIDHMNTRFSPHKAERILFGLGFSVESFDTPLEELSGGWKMRAALAGLLFQDPDILLLDEPTNHLDVPSVLWLEEFLLGFNHSLVLICHDRKFLNSQINRIMSLEPEGFRVYAGNYDDYLAAHEEEARVLDSRVRNQEQKVKEAKRFIERFRAKSTKARQAQSKIKMLKKVEIVRTHKKRAVMRFSFPDVPRSGETALSIQGVTKHFGGRYLYQDLKLYVRRGERVAIIGKNGVGKTTLLKMIAGETPPDAGQIDLGYNVTLSYYAQHHAEFLNEDNTILEEVYQAVPQAGMSFVRGVCGAFLFSGDDVDKPIAILSGGERARVALARILIEPGNLMVMDEPTNHLDLISCEVLTRALEDYNGTLVFVSHNQGLINSLATRIWDISDGKVEEYPGNLEDYIDHIKRSEDSLPRPVREEKGPEKPGAKKDKGAIETPKDRRRREAERRKLINRELGPLKKGLAKIEERIDTLERLEKTLSDQLADPETYKDTQESKHLTIEYGGVKAELDELLRKWEYQHEMLEAKKIDLCS